MTVFLFSLLSSLSHAVPLQLNHQGRIEDADGNGLAGTHELLFKIYDEENGGAVVWTETLSTVFQNGYYSVILGANETNNPLDEQVLSMYPLWMELAIDGGNPMLPRHELVSAPYAQMSGTAQSVEWSGVENIPAGFADGVDDDTLAGLASCTAGELLGWDGQAWACVSDNTLTESDIENFVTNGAIDLHPDTTIGGLTIATDNGNSLGGMSCVNDGEIAKWDATLQEWYCDYDQDTQLSSSEVQAIIELLTVLDLPAGTTLNGQTILTTASTLSPNWGDIQNRPVGLDDGDDDTQLGQADVVGYIEAGAVNLATGSTLNSQNIIAQPSVCTDGQVLVYIAATNTWDCGDDTDTTLTPTEMQNMIEAMTLSFQNRPSVNGSPVLSADSSLDPGQIDSSAATDGQVIQYSNGLVGWGAGGTGSGCEVVESIVAIPVRLRLQCGSNTFIVEGSTLEASAFAAEGPWTYDYHCALTPADEIQCWGRDEYGQVSGAPSGTFSQLASGAEHTCGLNTVGGVECWGRDDYAQVSNASSVAFSQIYAAYYRTCGIDTVGEINCWGRDNDGQVSSAPAGTFSQISMAEYHSCAIGSAGDVTCWGSNSFGQITNTPAGSFTDLTSGEYHTCGIDTAGSAQCWGYDGNLQVTNTPSGSFSQISAGSWFTCALDSTGQAQCWGDGANGVVSDVPADTFTQLVTGREHACGLKATGGVKCWGHHLGTDGTPSNGTFVALQTNQYSTCGILDAGNVICWGYTSEGQANPP